MKRWLAFALLLPLVGLLLSIAAREAGLSGASEWRIPIAGFDPRDPIRGRFIQFRYDWRVAGDPAVCTGTACGLCLSEQAGEIVATMVAPGTACPAYIDVNGSNIRRLNVAPGQVPDFSSRIFVSETSAPKLEDMLRREPMVVVAQLTRGGRLVNDRLEPAN
ncbi:GDYXXLXY domain-containing protein [uncultured Sphingosinicella sp.]|jgi:hypothetical protein|uniref:GDYXXLXY domain-containing protein n=1 Tax=uncultured Sphingosinicella sp. TaxID=478748 RepID=UPI0030D78B99|tara:strand:- start:28925 stop:29410 length:486 start_codon:yes stop_codon:yes gene_type:complete